MGSEMYADDAKSNKFREKKTKTLVSLEQRDPTSIEVNCGMGFVHLTLRVHRNKSHNYRSQQPPSLTFLSLNPLPVSSTRRRHGRELHRNLNHLRPPLRFSNYFNVDFYRHCRYHRRH
ncbi:hypothetical protein L484_022448 [Morus notabilis]|uniref:Uncharacterized protein n=1 Tax=Morus notabilis TaxID=981085 RepID=W9R2I6_9ROSA|nr:hypothetical protein L484_022448 [Morus notabilis]